MLLILIVENTISNLLFLSDKLKNSNIFITVSSIVFTFFFVQSLCYILFIMSMLCHIIRYLMMDHQLKSKHMCNLKVFGDVFFLLSIFIFIFNIKLWDRFFRFSFCLFLILFLAILVDFWSIFEHFRVSFSETVRLVFVNVIFVIWKIAFVVY